MYLESISISPENGKKPENLIVLLHGWGANYHDLAGLTSIFNLPNFQFMFPNAPFPHPQVPGGRSWYSLEDSNHEGIEESRQLLSDWLFSLPETTGISLDKTIVAGFSQGGAMSLDVGLQLPVAGVCSLSGYLHYEPKKQNNSYPPVLICHGKFDYVVPINLAQEAKQKLEAIGVNLTYQEFDISHEIIPQEIKLTVDFLKKVL